MTELDLFKFDGAEFPIVLFGDDQRGLPVTTMCSHLGIDPWAQRKSIERKPWSEGCTAVTAVQVPGDNQSRDWFVLDVKRIPMWLGGVDASRIKNEEAREKITKWQIEAADALAEYFFNGGAINPRATDTQLDRLAVRMAGIDTRKSFMAFLKTVYDASEYPGTTFDNWSAMITREMTKKALGISHAEFYERKKRGGGNFRNDATAEELAMLNMAEQFIRSSAGLSGVSEIKVLYRSSLDAITELTS